MATALYNCKRCKVGRRVEYSAGRESNGYRSWPYRLDEKGARVFPGAHVVAIGGGKPTVYGGEPLGLCPTCGKVMAYGMLVATVRAEVKCDARCAGARGHSCDCSCGGKNHGAGWSQLGAPMSKVLAVAA